MKKLLLFSDGTGNSGGGVNSTVWRLYEAVDRSPVLSPQQVTFYDDGVGTQENSAVRAISGGTGIGTELGQRPYWLTGFVVVLFVLWLRSKKWSAKIRDTANLGWAISMAGATGPATPPKSSLRFIRKSRALNGLAIWFQRRMASLLLLPTIVGGIAFVLYRWLGPMLEVCK